MKQGDSVTLDRTTALDLAQFLRDYGWDDWADKLDPQPKVTDLSAIDYLAQQLYAKELVGTTGPAREHAMFAVKAIATWLRAANTNSLAAALILGEQT